MTAYYNEIDPFAAAWLRNLIAENLIAPGDVDERSIEDVRAGDLIGYTQCHFFAGIGGWSYALRLAGWPDDRPVWTGSCPCQPFSLAGGQSGAADERHLWPAWFRLIQFCRPPIIFGEQVEAAVGFGWIDRVFADLEAEDHACGTAVLGAHSVGAPHIRQRLFWVANRAVKGWSAQPQRPTGEDRGPAPEPGRLRHADGLANASGATGERNAGGLLGAQAQVGGEDGPQHGDRAVGPTDGRAGYVAERLADADEAGRRQFGIPAGPDRDAPLRDDLDGRGPDHGDVANADGRDASTEGLQRGGEYGQQQEDRGAGDLGHAESGGFGVDGSAPREGGHAPQPDAACVVADPDGGRRTGQCGRRQDGTAERGQDDQLDDAIGDGRGARRDGDASDVRLEPDAAGEHGSMGDACGEGLSPCQCDAVLGTRRRDEGRAAEQPSGSCSAVADPERDVGRADEPGRRSEGRTSDYGSRAFWDDVIWIVCTDGKARPTKPSIQPLAYGVPNRVGKLRGAGNAIVPETAAVFIEEVMGVIDA